MKKLLLTLLLLSTCFYSFADGIATGKVKGYVVTESIFYVQLDASISNAATCNTTNRFAFKLDQNHSNTFVSSILAAYHADTDVRLTGTGSCTVSGNSETLRKVCTLNVPC